MGGALRLWEELCLGAWASEALVSKGCDKPVPNAYSPMQILPVLPAHLDRNGEAFLSGLFREQAPQVINRGFRCPYSWKHW